MKNIYLGFINGALLSLCGFNITTWQFYVLVVWFGIAIEIYKSK